MLVIFLICGDEYVKVAHFVPLLDGVGVGDLGKELFRCRTVTFTQCTQLTTQLHTTTASTTSSEHCMQ